MAPSSDINHLSHPCIYGDSVSPYKEKRSGFLKWFSQLFKSGSNRGKGGRHLQQPAPARSLDDRTRAQKEKEDQDHALALSLAEDLKKPNAHQKYRWRTDTDEDYARSLQDSLNSSANPPYAPSPFYPREQKYVAAATNTLSTAIVWNAWALIFIQTAFVATLVVTQLLSMRRPYHKSCFKELSHPKCEVCHQFIPINAAGLIEYRCHPFWSQKYCPSHEYDNTARCCSCERLESWKEKYYILEDGRSLCLECMESAIMDTGDCQPLYHSIRDYYEGMNMRIDQQIPMLLVKREALNEAIVGEENGLHHLPETRGLCLSEEQTVTSVHRRPRIGGRRLIGMRTQPQKLTRKCDVTAILVIYGLPRLLTGAILAHELMHAWLRLKGFRNLNPEVEEGICQVLSYMWLESEVMPSLKGMPSTSTSAASSSSFSFSSKKGAKSQAENKLGEFFKNQIVNDSSPAYGGGFRAANEAVNKYGLRSTLEHIRLTEMHEQGFKDSDTHPSIQVNEAYVRSIPERGHLSHLTTEGMIQPYRIGCSSRVAKRQRRKTTNTNLKEYSQSSKGRRTCLAKSACNTTSKKLRNSPNLRLLLLRQFSNSPIHSNTSMTRIDTSLAPFYHHTNPSLRLHIQILFSLPKLGLTSEKATSTLT
ncbi:protein DA1-related 2 isoform X2 [Senna tora]|uniref:Protein DA1-related 2 isoform X2 n=1 Tax=Senna tora TaxID=362788 RepID=A0A834T736_9FABA|nr:protein DA1-related 2 isoform X2 [Senna tora]